VRANAAQMLNAACRELSGAPLTARRVIRLDERTGKDMLLRPAPISADSLTGLGYVIGLVRLSRREETTGAARVAAATLGLSEREGALAEGISRGLSILEAGHALQLTPETARNYTKRIYAKTGASGQADLVRLLLTGLSPFA
ncbi:MAG: LuxR family transcriptional regulator, partial [Novosphingobium sp.]|nr:LuxR family transcriptional regulator [Novosphingobium sp.]